MTDPIYINGYSVACAQGADAAAVEAAVFADRPSPVSGLWPLISGLQVPVGKLAFDLADSLPGETRTNRLVSHLLAGIGEAAAAAISAHGPARVAVIVGSSTTGIDEATHQLGVWRREGRLRHRRSLRQRRAAAGHPGGEVLHLAHAP